MIIEHVFNELRAFDKFRNVWTPYDDMVQQPNLLTLAARTHDSTHSDTISGFDVTLPAADVLSRFERSLSVVSTLAENAAKARVRLRIEIQNYHSADNVRLE